MSKSWMLHGVREQFKAHEDLIVNEDPIRALLPAEAYAAGVAAPAVHARVASLHGGRRPEPHNHPARSR